MPATNEPIVKELLHCIETVLHVISERGVAMKIIKQMVEDPSAYLSTCGVWAGCVYGCSKRGGNWYGSNMHKLFRVLAALEFVYCIGYRLGIFWCGTFNILRGATASKQHDDGVLGHVLSEGRNCGCPDRWGQKCRQSRRPRCKGRQSATGMVLAGIMCLRV